jgi:hypothetical protein
VRLVLAFSYCTPYGLNNIDLSFSWVDEGDSITSRDIDPFRQATSIRQNRSFVIGEISESGQLSVSVAGVHVAQNVVSDQCPRRALIFGEPTKYLPMLG